MEPLNSTEIRGNWATLLLPIDKSDDIDYGLLGAEIDRLISFGVDGIYSNGTAGEFYNQTEEEFDSVNELLADKCNAAGMPFQIGCSHMSPILSLERVKRALKYKPGAIQVILPDWFPPTFREITVFLQRITEAADGIGIVLYNPPHAKMKFSPVDFETLRNAGVSLAGTKLAGGNEAWYRDMKKYASHLSVFIPGHHLATGIQHGAHGAYSNIACLHPLVAQHWYRTMLTDMPKALELQTRIQQFMQECIIPFITHENYSNQAVDKFMAALGAWSPITTQLRWPYISIPEARIVLIRERAKSIIPEFFPGSI
jgi:4-hydroxy-tetrahydrodipicolinate synthase